MLRWLPTSRPTTAPVASLVAAFVAAIALSAIRSAGACDTDFGAEFELDESLVDDEPPAAPYVTVGRIGRGGESGCSEAACDHLGSVKLLVTPADPEDDVGYLCEVVNDGGLAYMEWPTYPVGADDCIALWQDGTSPFHPAISVVFSVTAVDRAGNESEPVEVVVTDGRGMCGTPTGASTVTALFAAVIARARRPRAPTT